ncbi:hypothetical protein H640_02540 [Cutibacterium granulosum TM11]|uniref:Uncharacterized protein n=1 Tax=Cutibacterium granulosum TM11 TaxID=1292373 RepID=A0ACB4UQA1_9ACTN|nr:hypothetical protein H640_02540 [Cutibacterium granulosum TM11]
MSPQNDRVGHLGVPWSIRIVHHVRYGEVLDAGEDRQNTPISGLGKYVRLRAAGYSVVLKEITGVGAEHQMGQNIAGLFATHRTPSRRQYVDERLASKAPQEKRTYLVNDRRSGLRQMEP